MDGKDRIVASRMLTGEPLVVVATKSLDATLATWRTQTKFFVTVAVLSIGLLVLTLYLIFRQMTHRALAGEAAARHRHEHDDAGPADVRPGRAADRLQSPLYRDVSACRPTW